MDSMSRFLMRAFGGMEDFSQHERVSHPSNLFWVMPTQLLVSSQRR
jgi:hypothetical protein